MPINTSEIYSKMRRLANPPPIEKALYTKTCNIVNYVLNKYSIKNLKCEYVDRDGCLHLPIDDYCVLIRLDFIIQSGPNSKYLQDNDIIDKTGKIKIDICLTHYIDVAENLTNIEIPSVYLDAWFYNWTDTLIKELLVGRL